MGRHYFRGERKHQIGIENTHFRWENPQNEKLFSKALTYEERYFKDMTMNLKSLKDHYMCYYKQGEEWVQGNFDDPPYIDICGWKIVEKKLRKLDGYCNLGNLEIVVKQGETPKERKLTLLHEMIHVYEAELRWAEKEHGKRPTELVFIFVYKNLVKRLGEKKANSLLKTASNSLFLEPGHSILFTLKSLELDARLKLPFGSVFSYGKTEWYPNRKWAKKK